MKLNNEEITILIYLLQHEIDFLTSNDELMEAKKLQKLINKIKGVK